MRVYLAGRIAIEADGGRVVDERRFPRMGARGRKLKLLIDGSPASFALQDISEGGAKGKGPRKLVPGAKVHVNQQNADGGATPKAGGKS